HTRSKRDWSADVCSSDLERISSILLALLVASISDISMIQWPCSLANTLSSSSFFRSSENHSSCIARNRKKVDFPAPWPPTIQSRSEERRVGKESISHRTR